MTTTTNKPDVSTALAEAEATLTDATSTLNALKDRMLAGDVVKASVYRDARADVEIAELHVEGARRAADVEAERLRLARIAELEHSVNCGDIFQLARAAADTAAKARRALDDAQTAFAAHQAALRTAANELSRLRGEPRAAIPPPALAVDGVKWTLSESSPERCGMVARQQLGGANNGTHVERVEQNVAALVQRDTGQGPLPRASNRPAKSAARTVCKSRADR